MKEISLGLLLALKEIFNVMIYPSLRMQLKILEIASDLKEWSLPGIPLSSPFKTPTVDRNRTSFVSST